MSTQNIADAYPLSPMQEGLLFHNLYAPDSGVYVTQLACTLSGLQLAAFQQAWQHVMERHPILRTAFAWQSVEKPLQVVGRRVQLPLEQHDWRGLTGSTQEAQCQAYLHADRRRGFQLSKAPLMRLALFQVASDIYTFVWSHHHILLDGWSVSLLLKEVLACYAAFSCGQPLYLESPRSYRDYIAWLQQQDAAASERFWRACLQVMEGPTFLARVLPLTRSGSGHGTWQWQLPAAQTQALQRFAQAERLTLNTVVQGVWALLLQRYTGQNTVVFGVTGAGRPPDLPGAEHLVGLFINTLPMVQRPSLHQPVVTWLHALQAEAVAMREHEHTPLYEIQRWAGQGGQSLFDSLLVFENYPIDAALRTPPAGVHLADVRVVETTHYALTVSVTVHQALEMCFDYARAQFDETGVARLSAHFGQLLAQIVENPRQTGRALELLTAAERAQVVAWNTLPQRLTQALPVPLHISRQAQTRPEAVALEGVGQLLTYGMLERRANQLAQRLVRLGVGPEVRVGLHVERSLAMVVGMLGIWKAGGAYVPLDPASPPERLASMLADAGIGLLVTQGAGHTSLPRAAAVSCIDLEDATLAAEPATAPPVTLLPEQLAYVIYTSGSTGTPKGVAVTHGPLGMHCQAMGVLYDMTPADRALHFAALGFDAAVEQWAVPLMHGACLVLGGQELWSVEQAAIALTMQGITRLDVPPAYAVELAAWVQAQHRTMALQTLTVGGEALARDSLELLLQVCKPASLLNAYGPTEAIITPLLWVATNSGCTTAYAPIGKAVGERTAYILDDTCHVVPVGVTGELYIGGAGLARGYHGQPGLTAARFLPDPLSNMPGGRLYRTGDRARWQPDGTVEYMGRSDEQVKVRGFRIEPGEIEAVLQTHAAITAAVVVAGAKANEAPGSETPSHEKHLVAYLVPAHNPPPSSGELRRFLQMTLPDYMVPSLFLWLEALPRTASGKIDRRALPIPESWQPQPEAVYVAPRTEVQGLIATIWQETLQVEKVGIHDNFFDLGGHSLLVARVWNKLRHMFPRTLSMVDMFQYPTVHALAAYLSQDDNAPPALPSLEALDDRLQAGKSRMQQQLRQRQHVEP